MRNRWNFTILLGLLYLSVFHFWLVAPAPERAASTVGIGVFLSLSLLRVWRDGYFGNAWDAIFHATVILDIVVEGLVIPLHENLGFYWCALAFAVVIGGYRQSILSRRPA